VNTSPPPSRDQTRRSSSAADATTATTIIFFGGLKAVPAKLTPTPTHVILSRRTHHVQVRHRPCRHRCVCFGIRTGS
jgi:hypothetical protein